MPGRPFSRRTALGAALAAPLALAACDIDPPVRQTESSAAIPPPPEDSGVADGVPTAPLATVPDRILPALAKVRRSEQRLLRDVREGCLAAASGDLARVLASIAASTSQHSAALTTEVTE